LSEHEVDDEIAATRRTHRSVAQLLTTVFGPKGRTNGMTYSNFAEEPDVVKATATRAAWKTRRVKAVLGAHVSVTTSAFGVTTLVEGGTDDDLKALTEAFREDATVVRSNSRFISVEWATEDTA
jgi:hypothetical protein